ncbi:hypothetical protein CCR75_002219 [Bremia lactucae]|uniref:Uncharacterized protein n=1 Tax=Bremia lactucae TaxID=4779 RepID=A0A976FPN1_BRELC|nr:hypothetical protein CCR75_002219 [Bremia lactucae]
MTPSADVITNNMLQHPPPIVWRVAHADNQDTLARARLPNASFETETDFQRLKSQHLDWSNRTGTPFLSTFSDKSTAECWGRKLLDTSDVWIYSIDTKGLILFPTDTDELLIFGGVPNNNIGVEEEIHNLEKGDLMMDETPIVGDEQALDDLCYDHAINPCDLVHNDRTGLNYQPDDDAGMEEDEDWIDFAEYQMDH